MTPLTHAAVGTLLCKYVRKLPIGNYAWILAIPLALCSHYALDAIPHFEGIVAIPGYKLSYLLTSSLGLIGIALSFYLIRRNPEAGTLCAALFAWIGIGNYTLSGLRIATALVGILIVAKKTTRLSSVGYFIAGIFAILPDIIPTTSVALTNLHYYFHYKIDMGTRWYASVHGWPVPETFTDRIHNPHVLAGFCLELLIEGVIFLGAVYLLTEGNLDTAPPKQSVEVAVPAVVSWVAASQNEELLEETLEQR